MILSIFSLILWITFKTSFNTILETPMGIILYLMQPKEVVFSVLLDFLINLKKVYKI